MYIASIQTFDTKTQAEKAQAQMMGWDTEIVENQPLPFLPESDENKTTFSIRCNGTKYLYTDGYVR